MSIKLRNIWRMSFVATPIVWSAWACAPSSAPSSHGRGAGSTDNPGAGHAGATNGTGNSAGASSDSPGEGTFTGIGAGGTPATEQLDGGCFAVGSQAEQVVTTTEVPITTTVTTQKPVDMFIMYDQSGSMSEAAGSGTKWSSIAAALQGFVNSPTSAGIGVGIGYFPFSSPVCFGSFCIGGLTGGSCTASDYAKPDVPIDVLPTVAPKIIASVNAHNPGGGTPTAPALTGAEQYAQGWAAAHPDRKTIIVLATDGDPTGCNANTVQDVANIAAAGLATTPSVETFVIGVGTSLTSLNSIAAAGGSGQALIVDASGSNPTQEFLDAMNKIRETVTTTQTHTETHTETHSAPVPCEWGIPAAPDKQKFDKTKVNVEFAMGTATPQRIGFVASAADCANVTDGWHYDDPTTPTKVLVCPQTCKTIQATTDARINVVFGCSTEPAPLH